MLLVAWKNEKANFSTFGAKKWLQFLLWHVILNSVAMLLW